MVQAIAKLVPIQVIEWLAPILTTLDKCNVHTIVLFPRIGLESRFIEYYIIMQIHG